MTLLLRRRVSLRAIAGVLLVTAVVNFLALDHTLLSTHELPDGPISDEARAGHFAEHAKHCHIAPAVCGNLPVPSGPGQLLFADPLLVLPDLNVRIALNQPTPLLGGALPPPTPPPRA
jgi:hypothetical protein